MFAPLEKAALTGTAEQLGLLQYRSICRELYAKEANIHGLGVIRGLAGRGSAPAAQREAVGEFDAFIQGTQEGVELLRSHKRAFDDAFQRGDWSDMHGTVVWFESPPPLMCSSLVAPHYDFAGERLPGSTGWYSTDDMVSLDLLGVGERGVAILAWRTRSLAPGEALARTLAHLPRALASDALVRLVFEGTDNWYARPSWWTTLPEATRRELIQRVPCGGPVQPHTPRCLAHHTTTYDMPAVVGIDHVNWR
ncbi:hypothetical protein [Gemmatimonas sp.]|uniref:hypothetical protein n=1 Tax=Gemmatimonas sp. TaxID=1962908 RepID=UPI00286D8178|nr:hypothetical protein [Gemmatimonas sp.]